jgi:hypothetical protein
MICVYLSRDKAGEFIPEWAAFASHDFSGDDLRRRWDDPELEKLGDHPVVYAGAGSHASYYSPGEYLTELELPFMSPLVRLMDGLQSKWRKFLRQAQGNGTPANNSSAFNIFKIPFVDYARGDGFSIGPGGDREWGCPRLLNPPPAWAVQYRGLWGLYARDPIAGENAPAGPVYNREGEVRRSWYDPLGWSGLDKVPPRELAYEVVEQRCIEIKKNRDRLAVTISEKSKSLTNLWIEAAAMQAQPHMANQHATHQKEIDHLSAELRNLRSQYAADGSLLESLSNYANQLSRGDWGPLRAHIRRAHHPASDTGLRLSRFAETWAAISIGLMMLGFVGIIMFAQQYLIFGLISMLSILVFIEAGFRRQLTRLISGFTIALSIVSAIILVFEFFWQIVVAGVILAGGYIIWENIKELYT